VSEATDLVAGDTSNFSVFVRDMQTGVTSLVSVGSNGSQGVHSAFDPAISANGRFVTFRSAGALVADDTNLQDDLFVRDRVAGTTIRVSVASDGTQIPHNVSGNAISADGRFVAFTTVSQLLVANDTNQKADVFVHDTQTRTTTRVSVSSTGAQASADSGLASLSADGRFVAFVSYASDLVPNDTNNSPDVFVHDRQTHQTLRVAGTHGVKTSFNDPQISGDGRFLLFASSASDLVPNDANQQTDLFRAPNPHLL